MINYVVYEILLNKTQKVSAAREASEFLDSDCDEKNTYHAEKMIIDLLKRNLNYVSMRLNANRKVHM